MKNWKNDDELLNLAFGELSDRDSQAFEARLLGDSSAQKELDLLRTLRSDLTAIRDDIPEMQFSKERLREAILSSGTKPARHAFPWLNWVLGPAALASVAALAFVMTKGVNHKEPVIVASNQPPVEKVLPKVEIKAPAGLTEERVASNTSISTESFPDIADTHWAFEAKRTTKRISVRVKPSKRKIRTTVNTTEMVATNDRPKPSAALTGTPTSGAPAVATKSADTAIVATVTDSAPIILIDAQTDSGVGAPTATEVSNPSNVAIGG